MKSSSFLSMMVLFLAAQICVAAYPERPIRLIVPVAPGGAVDVVGRITAQKLGGYLGQNVVVDNRPGANYIIGTEVVSKAAADGYTLLTTAGGHTINPVVYKKLPYDTFRDFTPISHICNSSGLVIVVHPSVQIHTLQQLIDFTKANPGKMIYVSAGWGNSTHIAGEQFQAMAGVKLTHVPYRSAGPAVTDLLGGQVPLMFGPSPVVVPLVQAGRLRPLAFTGLKRTPQLPNVPTVDEAGIKGYESTGWYGLYGPRGMPRSIVDKLNAAVKQMVQSADVRERFNALNLEPIGSTPEEFAKFLKDDYERYVAVAKAANIQPQ
ncbi:MAG: tripartite tricarboxylate transporter substrate binding protein [Burkholderiales bacterium]